MVKHQESGFTLCRLLDNIKPFVEPQERIVQEGSDIEDIQRPERDDDDVARDLGNEKGGETEPTLRRSERKKDPNPRYI
mgnify:CR=1 FL=1